VAVSCEHDSKSVSSTEGGEILMLHAVELLVMTLNTELIQCSLY